MYEIAMDVCENHFDEIKDTIRRIVQLWHIENEEGFFGIESYIYSCEEFEEANFLGSVAQYLAYGVTWEEVEQMLSNRILVMENDKKKYLCLIYKEGIKMMMIGRWNLYGEISLLSLIPEEYEKQVSTCIQEVMEEEADKRYQERAKLVTQEYQNLESTLQDLFSDEMKLFEEELQLLPNHVHTQTWLRQMSDYDVALLMMVGSNAFRESILSNMSSRVKIEVMDDVVQKTQKYKNKQLSEIRVDVREVMKRALEGDME